MSVADEITRLQSAKTAIAAAIEGKGVTVPATTKLDGMAALIGQISGGGGNVAMVQITPAKTTDDITVTWDDLGFTYTTLANVMVLAYCPRLSSASCLAIARQNGITNTGSSAYTKASVTGNNNYNGTANWGDIYQVPSVTYDSSGIILKKGSGLPYEWVQTVGQTITIIAFEIE